MTTTEPASAGRRTRLQISLRLLLLGVTAFGIGFPIWYCWPFRTTRVYAPATPATPEQKVATTWKRQFGGEKTKSGPQTEYHRAGKTTTTYEGEQKHGPIEAQDRDGRTYVQGHYANGLKEGVWQHEEWTGEKRTESWHLGKRDGPFRIDFVGGAKPLEWRFAAGRVTHAAGGPVRCLLLDKLEAGLIDEATATNLRTIVQGQFSKNPLLECLVYLGEHTHLEIQIDPFTIADPKVPCTTIVDEVDAYTYLVMLAKPHKLECDYRYGFVWLTTVDDADWQDPTGVSKLVPPAGSALAGQWNKDVSVEFAKTPFLTTLAYLRDVAHVEIDSKALAQNESLAKTLTVSFGAHDHPFRDVLGAILYETGCTCRLDGETIVILPPETP